ncbi:MAG: DUF5996 family protein [Myxococcota bacterium]
MMTPPQLPPLPYDAWEETKATLHLFAQIMGKVKLAHHPKDNHWWHTTLHLSPRGITTRNIPTARGSFELEIDVHRSVLTLATSDGATGSVPLPGLSVAGFYTALMAKLREIGYPTEILAEPYDMPHSTLPFAQDDEHARWDAGAVTSFHRILLFVEEAFKTFAGRSFSKTSPAHLFWHSFDFAVTRFTGREVADAGGARRSDIEAYSHEVISFGFWPGDPSVRFPAFYSYTAPEPDAIADHELRPTTAWWQALPTSHLAMLKYDDLRVAPDPRATLLDFMQSAFDAGCACAQWSDLHRQETAATWDRLDIAFPATAGKERR